MNFIGLIKDDILKNSVMTEDGYYRYILGEPLEVTTIKNINSNKLISSNLTARKLEDELMIRYTPTNEIYFSREFLELKYYKNFASLFIDYNIPRIYIGAPSEFKSTNSVVS